MSCKLSFSVGQVGWVHQPTKNGDGFNPPINMAIWDGFLVYHYNYEYHESTLFSTIVDNNGLLINIWGWVKTLVPSEPQNSW